MDGGTSSESDVPPAAIPTPPPPPPLSPRQPVESTSVREPAVVLKLVGEDRPFPSVPEVLQRVLQLLKAERVTIKGLVRTGACYHEAWPESPTETDRVIEALNGKTILRWQVSAKRAGERLPMYIVLNASGGSSPVGSNRP